jgi:peptidase M15-like protein
VPQPGDRLTKDFSLPELIASDTAARDPALAEQFDPPANVRDNLRYLAERVLQPLRDEIAWPLHVNSGYRSPALNAAIKGSKTSQHMVGEAADVVIASPAEFLTSEGTAELRAMCQTLYHRATDREMPLDHNANFYLFAMVALDLDQWDVDQVIHEYGDVWGQPRWVHIAASSTKDNRRITVIGPYTNGYEDLPSLKEPAVRWQGGST